MYSLDVTFALVLVLESWCVYIAVLLPSVGEERLRTWVEIGALSFVQFTWEMDVKTGVRKERKSIYIALFWPRWYT